MNATSPVNPTYADRDRFPLHFLEYSAEKPTENLALDEALLETAAQHRRSVDVLRIWESSRPLVVVGRASVVATEVRQDACRDQAVPVLRRTSGGCAVVVGPGCWMYSLILNLNSQPLLRAIGRAHEFVLRSLASSLARPLGRNIERAGTSDLAIETPSGLRKFSGNSLRVKSDHLLYHGTILYDFSLPFVDAYLKTPPRQPAYRADRAHSDFVTNLPLSRSQIRSALVEAFGPVVEYERASLPTELTAALVREKYSRTDWNLRH